VAIERKDCTRTAKIRIKLIRTNNIIEFIQNLVELASCSKNDRSFVSNGSPCRSTRTRYKESERRKLNDVVRKSDTHDSNQHPVVKTLRQHLWLYSKLRDAFRGKQSKGYV
jgi:hypothetical protein